MMTPRFMDGRPLTATERRVLDELCKTGASNAELAEALCVAMQTIKFHLTHAMRKSGQTTRTGLALWWIREGRWPFLVEQDEASEEEFDAILEAA